MYPRVFAVKHLDSSVRMESRSGGVFTALSDKILKAGGTVYGCVLDEELNVKHIRATNKEERNRMRKSKYVQSDLKRIFLDVKSDLNKGRYVLFSGTPCQVDGLRAFLGKEYEQLLCIDIVCHGVPSPLVWKDYTNWIQKTKKCGIHNIEFRNKKSFGWKAHVETIELDNGGKIDSELYKKLFYSHLTLRPSCYDCPYKGLQRYSDLSIADFWGIDTAIPRVNDDKGVSLVLVNTSNGEKWFMECGKEIESYETIVDNCLQPPLVKGFGEPEGRKDFWEDYLRMPFDEVVRKYVKKNRLYEAKSWIYRNTKRATTIANKFLPNQLKLSKSK